MEAEGQLGWMTGAKIRRRNGNCILKWPGARLAQPSPSFSLVLLVFLFIKATAFPSLSLFTTHLHRLKLCVCYLLWHTHYFQEMLVLNSSCLSFYSWFIVNLLVPGTVSHYLSSSFLHCTGLTESRLVRENSWSLNLHQSGFSVRYPQCFEWGWNWFTFCPRNEHLMLLRVENISYHGNWLLTIMCNYLMMIT